MKRRKQWSIHKRGGRYVTKKDAEPTPILGLTPGIEMDEAKARLGTYVGQAALAAEVRDGIEAVCHATGEAIELLRTDMLREVDEIRRGVLLDALGAPVRSVDGELVDLRDRVVVRAAAVQAQAGEEIRQLLRAANDPAILEYDAIFPASPPVT